MRPTYRQVGALVHRGRDFVRAQAWTPRWSTAADQPADPQPVESTRLFAVLATYNEADVVEATVRNALAQGAERVYLVDNASDDDTVERAVAAGAVLADRYVTRCSEDRLRAMLMNSVVWHVSAEVGDPHLWWLWLDCDEFPHGPGNQTLVEYLSGLDRQFRVVGSTFYNHFPDRRPGYVPGFHPLDFQPMCEPFWQDFLPRCRLRHYKHPLVRFDLDGPFVLTPHSFHTWESGDRRPLVEPTEGIVTHHFQYREEQTTRARLAAIYGPSDGRAAIANQFTRPGGLRRLQSIDAVYAGRWEAVDNDRHVPGDRGVHLQPWASLAPDFRLKRWYSQEELDAAKGGAG